MRFINLGDILVLSGLKQIENKVGPTLCFSIHKNGGEIKTEGKITDFKTKFKDNFKESDNNLID